MRLPLQITYRDMGPSEAVDHAIRGWVDELDRVHPRITGCRVMVEAPHHHRRKGRLFHVRIDLTVPGAELVVGTHPDGRREHEDVYVAIRDAFRSARRALQEHAHVRRGDVKSRGYVVRSLRQAEA